MNTLFIHGQILAEKAKGRIKEFWKQEKGGSEIVAVIVLIAVVMLLAVLFKEQLANLVTTIWNSINANAGGVVNTPLNGAPAGP